MALPDNRPVKEVETSASTTSIATTPVVAVAIAPKAGVVHRVMAGALGATTGTITVAVAINGGSDIASSALTLAAGTNSSNVVVLSPAVSIKEGDVISFTASGGTGATIPGAYALVIR